METIQPVKSSHRLLTGVKESQVLSSNVYMEEVEAKSSEFPPETDKALTGGYKPCRSL